MQKIVPQDVRRDARRISCNDAVEYRSVTDLLRKDSHCAKSSAGTARRSWRCRLAGLVMALLPPFIGVLIEERGVGRAALTGTVLTAWPKGSFGLAQGTPTHSSSGPAASFAPGSVRNPHEIDAAAFSDIADGSIADLEGDRLCVGADHRITDLSG